MQCTKCGAVIGDNDKFCRVCGENVKEKIESQATNYCPECGKEADNNWTLCPHCGKDLKEKPKTGSSVETVRDGAASSVNNASCNNCGAPLKPNAKFCPKCGAAATGVSAANGAVSNSASSAQIRDTAAQYAQTAKEQGLKYGNMAKEKGLEFADNIKNFKNLDKSKKKKTLITCGIIACVVIILIVALGGGGYVSYKDAADEAVTHLNSSDPDWVYELVSYESLGQASAKNPMAGDTYHYTAVYLTVKATAPILQNDNTTEENYVAMICKENPGANSITDITGQSVEEAKKTFNEMKDRLS